MKKIDMMVISVFLLLFAAIYVSAAGTNPTGPTNLQEGLSERPVTYSPKSINAEAGNITNINITGTTQTQTWQGYYGEVTGTITLDDAQNNTMYNWTLAEPQGEIYASNASSVTWDNIRCVNWSAVQDEATFNSGIDNSTQLEIFFGITDDDVDGFNETFKDSTTHEVVYVGTNTIEASTCAAVNLYESSADYDNSDFVEILLTDNVSIIFTSIIESSEAGNDTDPTGFDGQTHDFQMIVAENGHAGDETQTPYYFYVELE